MNPGYRLLLEGLREHCRAAESGVVHFYTAQNQYGRIGLADGEIVHLSLHTSRGMPALPLLPTVAISSHRFEAGARVPGTDDLLDTPDLLAMLGVGDLDEARQPVAPRDLPSMPTPTPTPASAPPPAPVAAPRPVVPLSPATATALVVDAGPVSARALEIIEQELQKELGPMASSLVQECLPRARSASTLVEALADQLMPHEGEKFLSRLTGLLREANAQ